MENSVLEAMIDDTAENAPKFDVKNDITPFILVDKPEDEFTFKYEREDYKHFQRICAMTMKLERYCREQYLPIFNRSNTLQIMVRNLT